MHIIEIKIKDNGEHWYKEIRFLGMPIYYRHDYTKGGEMKNIGFNSGQYCSGEIKDDDYYNE